MKVIKHYLHFENEKTNALIFLPDDLDSLKSTFAVFTHGYTAEKGSILTWAIRLSESGIPCILFDLPGHYLGNYSEVKNFESFKSHSHELFHDAFKALSTAFREEYPLYEHYLDPGQLKLVLGGHSLGAMLSIKALALPQFENFTKLSIAVGLGMAPKNVVHLFDTPFYKSTLRIREQLVSPALKPDNVFPWIKAEKENIQIENANIHLITGIDDLVVGEDGMERFAEVLIAKKNNTTFEKPTKLPHHEPQLAAVHIKKYLKKMNWV